MEGINASFREYDNGDETPLIKIPSGVPEAGLTSHRLYEFRVCHTRPARVTSVRRFGNKEELLRRMVHRE